jgi:hypothetical protein
MAYHICKYFDGEFAVGWDKDSDYEAFESKKDAEKILREDGLDKVDEYYGFPLYRIFSDDEWNKYIDEFAREEETL